jgi:ketosteroid isomerase-like protein
MAARTFCTILLCLLGLFVAQNIAQEKPNGATIRALESQWTDAYKQRQASILASLLADDSVITTEDGTTYSKVGFVSYNMGPLRVDTAEVSDLKIRMYENVAVVTGNYHESGELGGKPYEYRDKVTDVWMKIGGKWQLIASHRSLPSKS